MTNVAARAREFSVMEYGHSYLTGSTVGSIAERIVSGRSLQWRNYGLAGATTAQMAQTARFAGKVTPQLQRSDAPILIVILGVNDYINGINEAVVLANHESIATKAKAANAATTVIVSTCPASTAIPDDGGRQNGNSLLIGEAGQGLLDYVIDLTAGANGAILAASIAAGDGTHPSDAAGRQAIADMHAPVLDSLMGVYV